MMMRAFSSVRCVCLLGLVASALPFAGRLPHALDPLSAVGLAFSLWIAAPVFLGIGLTALGLLRLMMGLAIALAPLATWLIGVLCDPLGLRQSRLERDRMDLFFPTHASLRGFHVS